MSLTYHFRKSIVLLFLFFTTLFFAQGKIDTIQKKSYNEIYRLINETKDSLETLRYCHFFLSKARKEKSDINLAKGYHILSNLYDDKRKLEYAKSIVKLTTSKSNMYYPGTAYQIIGDYYYDKRVYKQALDNYSIASSFAYKYNNLDLIFRSNLGIGNIKRQVGNLDEALDMYRKNLEYTKSNKEFISSWDFLVSISSMSSVFIEKKDIDSATFYNRYGIKEALKFKDKFHYAHFAVGQGITHYYKKEYLTAIDSLEKHIPYFENNKSLTVFHQEELSFIYYYSGESYLKVNKLDKAINYFKKVDTIFEKTQFLFPTLKGIYTNLIDYYKEKKDLKNQLIYINRWIKADSILDANDIYLNREVIKKYDLPRLKSEKENIIKKLESQKKTFSNALILLLILIIFLMIGFVFQYRKRKLYRARFDEIINKTEELTKVVDVKKENNQEGVKKINVPQDIIDNILWGLEVLEQRKEFTANNITLNSLAKKLQTNPNYLSKVVNYHKQVSFSNYLNNLRIDYAIDQLQTNPTYRKYTIKAISSEVGFNNVQSFAKAFYNSKGINPSYFMKQLEKTNA